MKKNCLITSLSTALVAALSVVESASAVSITVSPTSAAWVNPVGGANVATSPGSSNGDDPILISWGIPNNSGGLNPALQKSSYDYNGDPSVTFVLDQSVEVVKVGTFTHNNYQINPANPFEQVTLDLALTVAFGSTNLPLVFSTLFDHTETPNNAKPCAAGGTNPCPDLVLANFISNIIQIDGKKYLTILGFSQDGGQTIINSFLTAENQSNPADLFLKFELVSVPWQTDLAMATAGLLTGALVYTRARKKLS
jgi:hypothetical protein